MGAGIAIRFPPPWTVVQLADLADPDSDRNEELRTALAALAADAGDAARTYYQRMLPVLAGLGVDAIAALIVAERGSVPAAATEDEQELDEHELLDVAMAFAAVGSRAVSPDRNPLDAAWDLAAGNVDLVGVVERDTVIVEQSTGTSMVRSTCLRHAVEYADENGMAPYVRTVRYTYPLEAGRVGFLLFDTPTVVYERALTEIFDSMAATMDLLSAREVEPG